MRLCLKGEIRMVNKTLNAVGTTLVVAGVAFMSTSRVLGAARNNFKIAKLDKTVAKLEKELAEYE